MKRKNMKQVLTAMMSAAMVMSMPMVAMAAPEEDDNPGENVPAATETKAEVNAPIYSFDVTDVVVPTSLVVAFNPDELSVKAGGASPATAQVLSQNFGILNKSNRDKIVTVTLKVEDLNGDKITFVDTETKATNANEGEYAVYLTVVSADSDQVKVGTTPADADKDTDATAMANVTMKKATGDGVVTLAEGDNTIAFVLKKATYAPITDSEITLGTTTGNSVRSNLELTAVEKVDGITAFTFDGALNKKTNWTELTQGIKITAVYDFQTTYDYDTLTDADKGSVISGTGAMLDGVAPKFTTGGVGVINFTAGAGDKAIAEVLTMTAPFNGKVYDAKAQTTINMDAGTMTVASSFLGGWAAKSENPTVTIVYKNAKDEEVTATVTLKTHESN